MSPSEQAEYPFAITAMRPDESHWDLDCEITIFDGRNRIQATGNGYVERDLPRGLYVVRLATAGAMTETVISHAGPTERKIEGPKRSSALPATDAKDNHEYYSGPATHFSLASTADAPRSTAGTCRMMIMFRAREESERIAFGSIHLGSLQTADGETITSFGDADLAIDEAAGWAIFSTCLKPGAYLLTNEEENDQIVMPIHLFEGWDSLVFLPVDKRVHLARASLDIVAHGSGFDPADGFSQKIDAAVQMLGKRFGDIPQEVRAAAIHSKFQHPLAGIIGACAHFLSKDRDAHREATMMRNLWALMPGSPDVIALLFLSWRGREVEQPRDFNALLKKAETAFGQSIASFLPLSTPPILRPSLDAIIAQSQVVPYLIAANSWLETASISDYAAGPWAIFDGSPMVSLIMSMQPGTRNPLSHQKLYPIVKGVFSQTLELARRADWEISKNATIKSIANTPLARELGRTELGVKLQELQIQFFPDLIAADDTVADVVSKIRDQSETIMRIGVSSSVPRWLLDMARDILSEDDIDTMARDLASRAQVPLRVAAAALQLAQASDKRAPNADPPTLPRLPVP